MATAEKVCPTTGLACETADQVDSTQPFKGCPGQIDVIAFNDIEREYTVGPDGQLEESLGFRARSDMHFVVCGVNALQNAISARVVTSPPGETLPKLVLSEIRKTAAFLVKEGFDLPDDIVGLHAQSPPGTDSQSDVLITDQETYDKLIEEQAES